MAIASRLRHLRYGHFARIRHQKRLLAFLAEQDTRLTSSATGKAVTTDAVVEVAASQVFTGDANPSDGDTVTIGSTVYTFETGTLDAAYKVLVGADLEGSLANLVLAINGTGEAGVDYGEDTEAHPDVTAVSDATTLTITANIAGEAANAIDTTGVAGGGAWADVTMEGGVDAVHSSNLNASSHGMSNGEGPYVMTTSGTLPTGATAGQFLWVSRTGADDIAVSPSRQSAIRGEELLVFTAPGSGTHTLTKAMTSEGIYEMIRQNGAQTVINASDVDSLA